MTDAEREAFRKLIVDRCPCFFHIEETVILIEEYIQQAEKRGHTLGRKEIEKELMCELRDPNGTIWEHAKYLQEKADKSYREGLLRGAEIASELDYYSGNDVAIAIREEAEKWKR